MPSVIINDVELEARVGERLLNVARRSAAHIGFVCDGNGICQTCQIRVLSGAEHLSPPNEAEQIWMPDRRLRHGHRLACQTTLRGPGLVTVLTNAEELRRQTLHTLRPSERQDLRDRMRPLLENLVRMSADQLVRYPWNILATLGRVGLGRFLYPLRDPDRWLDDGSRVARRMTSGAEHLERGPSLAAVSRAARRAAAPAGPTDLVDPLAAPLAPPPPPELDNPYAAAQAAAEVRVLEAARALRHARTESRRVSW